MKRELVIHIWANYNGTYYAEDNFDNWCGDYDTAEEAYTATVAKYPNATVYKYRKPATYTI